MMQRKKENMEIKEIFT